MEERLDFLSLRSGQSRCTNVEASYCSESALRPGIWVGQQVSTDEASGRPIWSFLDDSAALIDANLDLKKRNPSKIKKQESVSEMHYTNSKEFIHISICSTKVCSFDEILLFWWPQCSS
jgi:hypothetical protein